MFFSIKLGKRKIAALLLAAAAVLLFMLLPDPSQPYSISAENSDYIKWVDFDVPYSLLKELVSLDTDTHNPDSLKSSSLESIHEGHIDMVKALAFLGAKYGGDFSRYKSSDLEELLSQVDAGESIDDLGSGKKLYSYYSQAYGAVLDGFIGEYEIETDNGWEQRYGLKAFSPIAATFPYSDFDDFGVGRSYGYNRKHLGHDMMAATGTPVIAVESGVVEVMGWNQYGGWRIGINSFDGRRYHYYAHLRQNRPYAQDLKEGDVVMAGDVIGYVGRTGYSTTENTNNIDTSHLHYGLQLIFDESQKEGVNQIWIDVYDICRVLNSNRSATIRDPDSKEHSRAVNFREQIPEEFLNS